MTQDIQKFMAGLEEAIPEVMVKDLLQSKKNLRIKFGADPSAPDLHLGHMVILNKLRLLQDMGHTVLFLIGDFTAMIGDPTGKSETRKPLNKEQIQENALTYQKQVFKILEPNKTEIVYNSTWLESLSSTDMLKLMAHHTVARMLERDDFEKRFKSGSAIGLHEFLYPLLQGYDSVVLENDLEIGGTDQKFNLLMGRHLQKEYGKKQQAIVTLPILEGINGVQKMSKSLGNHIGIMEDEHQIYGKLMSIPDSLIYSYYKLLANLDVDELTAIQQELDLPETNPKFLKEKLAVLLVTKLHSEAAAKAAQERFKTVFSKKLIPDDMPEISVPSDASIRLDMVISEHVPALSKNEIRRLMGQGGVFLDEEKITDIFFSFSPRDGQVLKVGKRLFFKIITG